jgi:glutathione S-transferase
MILIGQYDSSFVRRVGIVLRLYGLPFEHRPWSVFGDAERLLAINPTGSVPALVLDDGTVLVDSKIMLDHLDSLVPESSRLWPADRLRALHVLGFASMIGERMVSLFYERRLHTVSSDVLVGRREVQVAGTLAMLERERAERGDGWWFGADLTHADIAVACGLRHLRDSLPDMFDATRYPALAAHCARAEALPVFQEISQPFIAPA